MPTITLTDAYDDKLKALVTDPFEDTRESIICGLIDAAVAGQSASVNCNGYHFSTRQPADLRRLNPDSPDNLTFTRVRSATVDGRAFNRPKWNSIMNHVHILALKKLGSFKALKDATNARVRKGRFEETGFKFLPEADISVCGANANRAWEHTLRLARAADIPVRLTIEWLEKDAAAHPGETAILEWTPLPGS